jgi:two-component system sensor histidine kinase PilS (NtrC family)
VNKPADTAVPSDESPTVGGDSRLFPQEARQLADAGDTGLRRILQTYAAARAALAVALLATQLLVGFLGGRELAAMTTVCGAYAMQAVAWWLLGRRHTGVQQRVTRLQWSATIGVDLAVFSAMHWLDAESALNYGALLVLPVLMGGLLTARLYALATTAAAALMLLYTALNRGLDGGDFTTLFSQAGLAGAGLFAMVLVASELAGRLARDERRARGSLEFARQQAQLNRLVIEEMGDGVLVVNRQGQVRAANPAAQLLLGGAAVCPLPPFELGERSEWQALAEAVQRAFESGAWPEGGQDIQLGATQHGARELRVRARFTRTQSQRAGDEPLAVLFVEDLRNVDVRLRQERLAAMGRVSLGIAHEIRNPLAAVAQANALLQEDTLRPDQQRLVRIVVDNVERLKRIVDDVMEVVPRVPRPSRSFDATTEVSSIAAEWAHTVNLPLGSGSRLQIELPSQPLRVVFDPDHLRRVLVNLLDNALRHATDVPGAILLRLGSVDERTARLTVASDGAPISSEVEARLFEPFHSTRSRGTGLGLYICRELCVRHGGSIDYAQHGSERHANVFLVTMRRDADTR